MYSFNDGFNDKSKVEKAKLEMFLNNQIIQFGKKLIKPVTSNSKEFHHWKTAG